MSSRTLHHASGRDLPGRLRALRRSDAGSTIVEFALVAPILILLVFGAISFGRALWVQNVLVAGLREGARAAAIGSNTTLDSSATGPGPLKASQYISGVLGRTVTASEIRMNYCSAGSATAPCSGASSNGMIFLRLNLTNGTTDYFPFTATTNTISRLGLTQIYVRPAGFRWELAP